MEATVSGPVPGDASTVHYLPCKIDFSGRARVNTFFLVERDAEGAPVALLRGRELHGREVALGPDLEGLLLRRTAVEEPAEVPADDGFGDFDADDDDPERWLRGDGPSSGGGSSSSTSAKAASEESAWIVDRRFESITNWKADGSDSVPLDVQAVETATAFLRLAHEVGAGDRAARDLLRVPLSLPLSVSLARSLTFSRISLLRVDHRRQLNPADGGASTLDEDEARLRAWLALKA